MNRNRYLDEPPRMGGAGRLWTPARAGRLLLATLAAALPLLAGSVIVAEPPAAPRFELRELRGRVVWLAEALARRHGIATVPEARQRVLALETAEGELFPLVEDVRGRAFRRDERLRKIEVELLVRQHTGSPMVQVIRVFEVRPDGQYELDYWCEICAIAMFELKVCDCCQGPIELRRRRKADTEPTP